VPPALRPYVASRIPYDVDFGAPGVHRGLPDTTITVVLPLDTPLSVSWGSGEERRTTWSSLSGLHTEPAAIHHDGHQAGIQLALTLAGARAVLGLPAAELAGALTDLDEAVPGLASVPERLHDLDQWSDRVALVDRTLADLLARHGDARPRAEVGHALAALTRGARVEEVADEVGYSRRRLTELVRAECGVPPKAYQRIARFRASRDRLVADPAAPLADVAADSGYSDHAHLTREWAALAGCTPTAWLREEFPFVQAPEAADAEG